MRITTAFVFACPVLVGLCGCPITTTPPASSLSVAVESVVSGVIGPVALVAPDDDSGRRFVVTLPGKILLLQADGTLAETPFVDLSAAVITLNPGYDERGLLGLAFHPSYATNGRLFVFYTAKSSNAAADCDVVIAELRADPPGADRVDAATQRVLLRVAKPQSNHNGGQLAFGPDGFLYFGIGDGGGAGDSGTGHTAGIGNAQDLSTLLGKIGRIDVDAGDPYAIPPDNPFLGDAAARPEIFAFGFRNPWRFSFGPDGRLFVGDVGQALREEVNIVTVGGNYGWRIREGDLCFDPAASRTPPASCADVDARGGTLIEPILSYSHEEGSSVIGGFLYANRNVRSIQGRYVFADFQLPLQGGRLFAATEGFDGAWSFSELLIANRETGRLGLNITALGQDAAGELYVVANSGISPTTATGEIFRVVAAE